MSGAEALKGCQEPGDGGGGRTAGQPTSAQGFCIGFQVHRRREKLLEVFSGEQSHLSHLVLCL